MLGVLEPLTREAFGVGKGPLPSPAGEKTLALKPPLHQWSRWDCVFGSHLFPLAALGWGGSPWKLTVMMLWGTDP